MITAIVVFFLRIAFIAGEPTGKASFFFTAACRQGWWVSALESRPLALFMACVKTADECNNSYCSCDSYFLPIQAFLTLILTNSIYWIGWDLCLSFVFSYHWCFVTCVIAFAADNQHISGKVSFGMDWSSFIQTVFSGWPGLQIFNHVCVS